MMPQGTHAAQPVVQGGRIQPGDDGQRWLACDVIQQHKGFAGESLSRKGIIETINWTIMYIEGAGKCLWFSPSLQPGKVGSILLG